MRFHAGEVAAGWREGLADTPWTWCRDLSPRQMWQALATMHGTDPRPPPFATDPLAYWLGRPPGSSRSITGLRIVARNLALRRTIVWMLAPMSVGLLLGGAALVGTIADAAPGVLLIAFGCLIGTGLAIGIGYWHRHPVPSHVKMTRPGRAPQTLRMGVSLLVILALAWWLVLTWNAIQGPGELTWERFGESAPTWLGAVFGPVAAAALILLPQPLCLSQANARLRRLIATDARVRAELAERARNPGPSVFQFGPL